MVQTDERTLRFYQLYEQLVSEMTVAGGKPDISRIESLLCEIAELLRLSKGVTNFYRTPADEEAGRGETMISYDLHKPSVPVHTVRFVTKFMSIATMTVFAEESSLPLSEEELGRIDLTMRTTLTFISRNRLQDIAEELAFFDDQGFRNVRSFFKYLQWRGRPGGFDGMAAISYNLRHFSLVNKKFGRQAGDIVIKRHYQHIEELIDDNGTATRLGGDSFVCLCPQEKLGEMIDYFNEADVPFDDEGSCARVTACAGIFRIPDGYEVTNPNDIMGKIMYAYRVAQTGGQDSIIFYDEDLIRRREMSMLIQQQFPEAMKKEEFKVFYQPKVNIITGEICGAEALCRWFRDGKIVPPMDFIPVLEKTSEICRLDFYMLDHVCADIRRWLDEGRRVVRVSVNLSRKHMMDIKLLETLIGIIDRHNVPHEYIEIELTETTTDVEFKDLQRVVGGLQQENIWTSVDDFGMGYSSLNLLRVVPWNVLKVDKSFLPMDDESAGSIRSIMFKYVVALAKELGLECIVEGVETRAQLEILRRNDCELAQGFLFDKPLPVEEFEKRLDMKQYKIGNEG